MPLRINSVYCSAVGTTPIFILKLYLAQFANVSAPEDSKELLLRHSTFYTCSTVVIVFV